MNEPIIVDEFDEECFIIPIPEENGEDDENTEIVFPVLPPDEAAALL